MPGVAARRALYNRPQLQFHAHIVAINNGAFTTGPAAPERTPLESELAVALVQLLNLDLQARGPH